MLKRLLLVVGLLPLLGISSLEAVIICQRYTDIPIRNVVFQNASLLSQRDQEEIAGQIAAWYAVGEAAERVRSEYEGRGYFRARVKEEAVPVSGNLEAVSVSGDQEERYDVIVRVMDEGKQYRLGDLTFVHAGVFSETKMRRVFPIQRGEAFSWDSIYRGLDKLLVNYKSRGYVYVDAVPTTEVNDDALTVNVQIKLAEGERLQFQKMIAPVSEPQAKPRPANDFDLMIADFFSAEAWEQSPVKFNSALQDANQRNSVLESLHQTRWHPGGWVGSALSPCLTPSFTCESDGVQAVCGRSNGSRSEAGQSSSK